MKKINLILLVLPFILFSCDGTIDDILSTGQFDSTITGSITKDFNGEAAFSHTILVSGTSKGSTLGIGLSTVANQDESITLSITENDNIDGIVAGTYNYDLGSTTGSIFIPAYLNDQGLWFADGNLTNKVVISSVSGTIIKGSFELNMMDASQIKKIKITGTFNAVGTTTTN